MDRIYASENDFEGLNLFEWLECDNSPSWRMLDEFARHGYDVFCIEGDSFGWLIGGVRRHLDPRGKTIVFG